LPGSAFVRLSLAPGVDRPPGPLALPGVHPGQLLVLPDQGAALERDRVELGPRPWKIKVAFNFYLFYPSYILYENVLVHCLVYT
jgi:hypothetical protein